MQDAASDHAVTASTLPSGRDRVGVIQSALSPETRRLYDRAWALFVRFCAEQGTSALTASPDTIAAFVRQPARGRGRVTRILAAIDHRHRHHGVAPPDRDASLRAALRSARRVLPRVRKSPVLTPAQWRRLAHACPGDLAGRRNRALLLLAGAGLGRAALVGLQAEQLRFSEYGVRHGGTGAAEAHPIEVARSIAIACCPVRALED